MTHLARFIVALACISLIACTTLRPLPVAAGVPQEGVGSMVRVGFHDGSIKDLKVVELRGGGFVGARSAGRAKTERVEIRYADIVSLERAEFSVWKTAGLFGLILVVVAAFSPIVVTVPLIP